MLRRAPRLHLTLALLAALALPGALHAGPKSRSNGSNGNGNGRPFYDVTVYRTTFGIPHIRAKDWGSLGYGYGYAFAQDNVCVLAREIVESNGESSRFFGPGGGNLDRDLFYTFWNDGSLIDRFLAGIDPDLLELGRGYAAGYNRYLRDTGRDGLAEDCRGAEWVREIDVFDLFRVYHKLLTRAGANNLIPLIVASQPPEPLAAARKAPPLARLAAAAAKELRETLVLPEARPQEFGSNMYALGRDATSDGRGMVLVNPHFPWNGPLRFYQVHVTIPGVIDSMGASLFGSPLPNIAFNKDVAWSHTVSTAGRFTLHQLEIVPTDPTAYRVDGELRRMTSRTVQVQVRETDGSLSTREHTFWESEYGPIVTLPFGLGWTPAFAFAIQDVNRENFRIFDQYLRMNKARSVDELARAIEEEVALPWVNTAAADRFGNAYYADVGSIPNLPDAHYEACSTPASSSLLDLAGLYLLDGSRSECDLLSDPDAPQPKIFGAGNLPSIRRSDWVQNSNDSYWLANPEQRLEGFAAIIGPEGVAQGLRTRLGILQARARLAGTDGRPGNRFTLDSLLATVYDNRNLSAEIALDALLTLCSEESTSVDLDGRVVDVDPACKILGAWDRSMNPGAVGATIWREFWPNVRGTSGLYAVPFDAADPVTTPRGIDLGNPAVRTAALQALAEAVAFLTDNEIPLDAPWGQVHFEERNGERIPIHGGPGTHGVYNAISSRFRSGEGYTPITGGSSIVTVVTFGRQGPLARAVLTYSQSTDPESPHFADQTKLFSAQGINPLPFALRDIKRDPNLEVKKLRERRR